MTPQRSLKPIFPGPEILPITISQIQGISYGCQIGGSSLSLRSLAFVYQMMDSLGNACINPALPQVNTILSMGPCIFQEMASMPKPADMFITRHISSTLRTPLTRRFLYTHFL